MCMKFSDSILILPVLWPVFGALLSYLTGRRHKKARDRVACAVTVVECLLMALLLAAYISGYTASLQLGGVLGMGLSFELNGFGLLFACVTAYMWMMTTFFSGEYLAHSRNRNRYYFFLLITLGATAGVFLSADLFTALVCFEVMSMASYVCVAHEETPGALRAGGVYLTVAVIGGLTALMGLFLLYHLTGTLSFSELPAACSAAFADNAVWFYIAGGCILFGFGAKAGMYPLHIWLPMAHPVAPAPASALLSGIITKTGIFGTVVITTRIFAGDGYWGFVVLALGVITALLGGVLAVFSTDLKRTLACSSMSQLGFIFIAVGMMALQGEENALAVRGVILHMFNHSNLKLVLFMAAGVVLMHLHNGDLNNVRGYGRKKPLLKYAFLMGSLGISGIPLFNGYISKTLIHESIVEYIELLEEGLGAVTFAFASGSGAVLLFRVIEWLFLITGGMTVAYMTKLFVLLFVEKNADPEKQAAYDADKKYCSRLTAAVLAVSATVLPVLGIFPHWTQDVLADFGESFLFGAGLSESIRYFSLTNLQGALISILIGAAVYLLVIRGWMMQRNADGVREYVNRWPEKLDLLTLLYEPLVMTVLPAIGAFFSKCLDALTPAFVKIFTAVGAFAARCMDYLTDGVILFFRKTTHRTKYEQEFPPVKYRLAYYTGRIFDAWAEFLNRTVRKRSPVEHDYVFRFSIRQKSAGTFLTIISASVSFGFLMFAIGVVIVVVYLLVV